MSASKLVNITVPLDASQHSTLQISITLHTNGKKKCVVDGKKQTTRNTTVYLSGLSAYAKRANVSDALSRILGTFGEITDIRIPIHLDTSLLKGYVFVTFKDANSTAWTLNHSAQITPLLSQYILGSTITMAAATGNACQS